MNTSDNNSFYWFIFFDDQILLQKENETYTIPFCREAPIQVTHILPVEIPDGTTIMAAYTDTPLPETENFTSMGLRASYDFIDKRLYELGGKASEIIFWDKHSQFCPVCGTKMKQASLISKKCPSCQYEMFPAVSPAILVLIRKENSILLVHAHNFKGTFNGLVAGFLETGETLEQCVEREVKEETGLEINNIRYWGNQPWPYPSNLMIGFIADYVSGELKLQKEELSSGDFYTKDNLPQIPRKLSLARKMIDWWVEQQV